MRIGKENICIRNAEKKDCEQLAKWWNDGNVMAHAGFPLGLGTTAKEIEKSIATDNDDSRRRLIIDYRGVPIGEMSYRNKGDHIAEIGIKICEEDYQNKGLGRICLSLLIRELFRMGYEKIVLDTNEKNHRARHVYELLGFRKLSINKDSWIDQLGSPQSSVDYELLPEDFKDHAGQSDHQ